MIALDKAMAEFAAAAPLAVAEMIAASAEPLLNDPEAYRRHLERLFGREHGSVLFYSIDAVIIRACEDAIAKELRRPARNREFGKIQGLRVAQHVATVRSVQPSEVA